LKSFYQTGLSHEQAETIGGAYKGFNDSLASWGSKRVMAQQCGGTWLQTFATINGIYNAGRPLPALQLVTWNDYEEGTEIESGIDNCVSVTAQVSGSALQWKILGSQSTIDHFVAYISSDGKNLMSLGDFSPTDRSLDLCSYTLASKSYKLYVQAVGKPSLTNHISPSVSYSPQSNVAAEPAPQPPTPPPPAPPATTPTPVSSPAPTPTSGSGTSTSTTAVAPTAPSAELSLSATPSTLTLGNNESRVVTRVRFHRRHHKF